MYSHIFSSYTQFHLNFFLIRHTFFKTRQILAFYTSYQLTLAKKNFHLKAPFPRSQKRRTFGDFKRKWVWYLILATYTEYEHFRSLGTPSKRLLNDKTASKLVPISFFWGRPKISWKNKTLTTPNSSLSIFLIGLTSHIKLLL